MSRVETVLAQIETWEQPEIQALYQALARRLAHDRTAAQTLKRLEKYVGKGKGIWPIDAQAHVNQLRQDRALVV